MIDHREHRGHRAQNPFEFDLKSPPTAQSYASFQNFSASVFSVTSVVNLHF
jgi:hypothetical protein